MKKNKKLLLNRILAVLAFLVGALLLLTALESYMRGEAHFLLVLLSLINGLCGIVGGILIFLTLEQGRILLKWQFITGIFFVLFYAVVNNEWHNPTIFLTILFTSILVINNLKKVKGSIKNRPKEKKKILEIDWKSKLLFFSMILILVLTWTFNIEKYLNLFNEPNGEGLSFHFSKERSPKVQLFVEGGYLYDYFDKRGNSLILKQVETLDPRKSIDGELIVVVNSPKCTVNLEAYADENIRIRIINSLEGSKFIIDGDLVLFNKSKDYERWFDNSMQQKDWISSVQSTVYTLADKGYWKDISIKEGENYQIEVFKENEVEKDWEFFIISDQHSGYKTYIPELRNILNENPDFVVWNGDIVNWGFPTEYMVASAIAQSYPITVFPTIGNHDAWNDGTKVYNKYFGPNYYSFEYNGDLFVFLDTAQGVMGSSQLDWLESILKGWEDENIFIFSHMSPIDTVKGYYDTSDLIDPELSRTMHSKAESDYLLDLMENFSVDAFFSGHSHVMGRSLVNGTWYISSGALGGTVDGDHNVGYLGCKVNNDDYDCKEVVVKSNEEVVQTRLENYINAANVFGIPFLINKSIRISITILVLIVFELVWFELVGGIKEKKERKGSIL
jgi:predicted MPP superfamily phosphohydrolase